MQRKSYFQTPSHDLIQKHDTVVRCGEESDNFQIHIEDVGLDF